MQRISIRHRASVEDSLLGEQRAKAHHAEPIGTGRQELAACLLDLMFDWVHLGAEINGGWPTYFAALGGFVQQWRLDGMKHSAYACDMPATSSPLRQRALKLPAQKRLGLAALLLESVPDDAGVDPALLRELKKRSAELRSGKVRGLSTLEAYGFSL